MRPGIDPKVDYAFKRLFGREQNRPLLMHLLNAILKPPPDGRITELQLLNPFSEQDAFDDKLLIVDVKARDQSGRLFNVEMQMLPHPNFRGRVLYYWARLHQEQLAAGDDYHLLRPTISVCFANFVLFPQVKDYLLEFELRNQAHQLAFSPDLLLHTVELPKFKRRAEELAGPLDMWLYFLRHAETLDTAKLPTSLETPEIQRALEELNVLSQSDLERERYEARIKIRRDEASRLHWYQQIEANAQKIAAEAQQRAVEARQEGLEQGERVGMIFTYLKLLNRPLPPHEQLLALPLEELQRQADKLEQELRGR